MTESDRPTGPKRHRGHSHGGYHLGGCLILFLLAFALFLLTQRPETW